ncbi:hypothetical protein N9V74_08340 [Alteromonas sp.]|nr:hypothetical protein [Alteromonas sp.]
MNTLPVTPVHSTHYAKGNHDVRLFIDGFKAHIEIVLIVFAAMFYISTHIIEVNEKERVLAAPQVNDFFYIDYRAIDSESDMRFRYVPLKLLNINDGHYTFKVGNIAHSTPVSPAEHAKFDKALLLRNYYRKDELVLTQDAINAFVRSGAIYNARRPRNIYISGWMVLTLDELRVH